MLLLFALLAASRGERAVEPEDAAHEAPTGAFAHSYLGQDETDSLPHLAAKESRFACYAATALQEKGPSSSAVLFMIGFLRDLGVRRMMLQCANERSIVTLRSAVISKATDLDRIPQNPPEGDHRTVRRERCCVPSA